MLIAPLKPGLPRRGYVPGGDHVLNTVRDVVRPLVTLMAPLAGPDVRPECVYDVEAFAAAGVRKFEEFADDLSSVAQPAEDALYDARADVAAIAALAPVVAGRGDPVLTPSVALDVIQWLGLRLRAAWLDTDPRVRWARELEGAQRAARGETVNPEV